MILANIHLQARISGKGMPFTATQMGRNSHGYPICPGERFRQSRHGLGRPRKPGCIRCGSRNQCKKGPSVLAVVHPPEIGKNMRLPPEPNG